MQKREAAGLDLGKVLAALGTSEAGLTGAEAQIRLAATGRNVIRRRSVQALVVLARQLRSSLAYLLIAACLISLFLRNVSDAVVIAAILCINTLLAFFQEYRSEKTVEKLNGLVSKRVFARRDRRLVLIDEEELVPGDIAVLKEGDVVPADMRLVEADNLEVDESPLTGESLPVVKQATSAAGTRDGVPAGVREGDRQNETLLFAGTTIQKGKTAGAVYATGNDTEIGRIAALSAGAKKVTQYEKSLRSFSSFLMKTVFIALVLVFTLKLVVIRDVSSIGSLLLFLVALAIAVVPEALPVIATVTMSAGAAKLARKQVIVKRLSSLEDLGNINLLCTDKTGTLTENRMAVAGITSVDPRLFQLFAFAGIEAADIEEGRNPYDLAFMRFVPRDIKQEAAGLQTVRELPFNPETRQRRVVFREAASGKLYLVVYGAPETLIEMAETDKSEEQMARLRAEGAKGFRSLAIAYGEMEHDGTKAPDEKGNRTALRFLGFATFTSPLRASAKKTIETARKLGIEIKVLSGDSREVVEYVAREVGLIEGDEQVLTEDNLDAMTPAQLKQAAMSCRAFARITPSRKLDLIDMVKEETVVAYQGDGINDAPALKAADVGIAVDSATDIAKESADIVLLNEGLEVLIAGIHYGRSIFVNINKYIKYTMVGNWGNFFALATLYVFASDLPLLPVQVLLTSLITDIPLIMIAGDAVDAAEVERPEKRDVRGLFLISLVLGVPTALFELFFFGTLQARPAPFARTAFFLYLTFIQLAVIFSVRCRDFFWKGQRPWPVLTAAFAAAFVFSLALPYLPVFRSVFYFVPLPAFEVVRILLLTVLYFVVVDTVKVLHYRQFVPMLFGAAPTKR
jgi:Mg2+-importing ATPase